MPEEIKTPTQHVQKTNDHISKPVMPSAPPPEVLGMTFDLEQLPASSDLGSEPSLTPQTPTTVKQTEDKSVVPATTEKPKTEDKKDEAVVPAINKHLKPPTKPDDKKADDKAKVEDKDKKAVQVTVPKNDSFDYTGYSQEEVNHLKNMAVASRKFAGDLIKQNKEFAKQKDYNYLQHPEAYKLDPQYNSTITDIQFANKEADYWQKQLEQAKLGKAIKPITGWDKDGNPIVGAEVAASDAVEERLRLNYQNAINQANQLRGQLQQYPQKYQAQIGNDLKIINETRGQIFEWNTKPELMDYTININGLGDRSIKQIKEDFKTLWPVYMRNHVAVDTSADFMVALRIRDSELAEALAHKEVTETKMEEVKRAEPSSQVKPGKEMEAIHGIKEFDSAGMPE